MSGYSSRRSCGVPAYWIVSPRNVCLSVPQIPENRTCISTAPGSTSGRGNVSTSMTPGAFITAARTAPARGGREVVPAPPSVISLSGTATLRAKHLVEGVDVRLSVRRRSLQDHLQRSLGIVVEEPIRALFVAAVDENLVRLFVEQRSALVEEVPRNPRSLLHCVDEGRELVLVARALQHHLRIHPAVGSLLRLCHLDQRALGVADANVGAEVLDRDPGRLVRERPDDLGVLRYELEDVWLEGLQERLRARQLRFGHVVGLLRPGRDPRHRHQVGRLILDDDLLSVLLICQ